MRTLALRLLCFFVSQVEQMYQIREHLFDASLFTHLSLKIQFPPIPSQPEYINYSSLLVDNVEYTKVAPTLDGSSYTFEIPAKELWTASSGHQAYPPSPAVESFFSLFEWLVRLCVYDFARHRRIYFGPKPTPSNLEQRKLVVSMTKSESEFPCLTVNESSYFVASVLFQFVWRPF